MTYVPLGTSLFLRKSLASQACVNRRFGLGLMLSSSVRGQYSEYQGGGRILKGLHKKGWGTLGLRFPGKLWLWWHCLYYESWVFVVPEGQQWQLQRPLPPLGIWGLGGNCLGTSRKLLTLTGLERKKSSTISVLGQVAMALQAWRQLGYLQPLFRSLSPWQRLFVLMLLCVKF